MAGPSSVPWILMGLMTGVASAGAGTESLILIQTAPLAGFQYHAGAALFPLMSPGDPLVLRRESDNPHDARAVRVEWRGAMIGYAPRADNVDLARLLDHGVPVEGRIAHLQKARDPWKRLLMEIVVPESTDMPVSHRDR
jgi:hypothetical protein